MRSRTEMVTNNVEGSDYEEESDLEDSEEDWKPVSNKKPRSLATKSTSKSRQRKSGGGANKGRGGRKAAPAKKSRKRKNSSSEDEDSDDDDNESFNDGSSSDNYQPTAKKPTTARQQKIAATKTTPPPPSQPASTKKITPLKKTETNSENGSKSKVVENLSIQKPLQRKTSSVKSFPDRNGQFELLVCKSVLKDGIKGNPNICLWRRDGSSLLQKYIPDDEKSGVEIFKSSSVYSCWEDKKSRNYFDVKVQCHGDAQSGKIKILNLSELEKIAESLETDDEDVEEEDDVKKTENDVDDDDEENQLEEDEEDEEEE